VRIAVVCLCLVSCQPISPTVLTPSITASVPMASDTPFRAATAVATATPLIPTPSQNPLPQLRQVRPVPISGFAVAYSPDGLLVAGSSPENWRIIQVVEVATGNIFAQYSVPIPPNGLSGTYAMQFSPDGSLLAFGGAEKIVTVWRWRENKVVASINFPDVVNVLRFSSRGGWLGYGGTGETGGLEFFDLTQATPKYLSPHFIPHDIVFWGDGSKLVIASDNRFGNHPPLVTIWDWNDCLSKDFSCEPQQRMFPAMDNTIGSEADVLSLSADSQKLGVVIDGQLRLWDFSRQSEIEWPKTLTDTEILRAAIFDNHYVATFDHQGILALRAIEDGQLIASHQFTEAVTFAVSPVNNQFIFSIKGFDAEIWEIDNLLSTP
jgi:WD40 repeat protein